VKVKPTATGRYKDGPQETKRSRRRAGQGYGRDERSRRQGELKTYLVKPHADGGWKVQAEEATRATSVHRTKAEAVAAGKKLARSKTPSQLLVYKADGFEVQEEKSYE
jgi:Uncharacterized protein conserved in bacteria (DUF2188)